MKKKVERIRALWCFVFLVSFTAVGAQTQDTLKRVKKPAKLTVFLYTRAISDAKGNKRIDENLVCNYWLLNWLQAEAGFRQGERPGHFDSYYHYKLELQSKWFWQKMRLLARLSDDVINYPSPSFRKTNKLFAAEGRVTLGGGFRLLAGAGYAWSAQQNYRPDALPTSAGVLNNSPIFRLTLRYHVNEKNFIEAVYGSYDVFNPYLLNQPFLQISGDDELSRLCTFAWYLRYQYNNNISTPFNYFIGLGVRFHLLRT